MTHELLEKQEYLTLLRSTMDEVAADMQKSELLKIIRGLESIPVARATQFLKDLATGPFPEESKTRLTAGSAW